MAPRNRHQHEPPAALSFADVHGFQPLLRAFRRARRAKRGKGGELGERAPAG